MVVTNCGRICLGNKKINFSTVFAGQAVGIKEVHDDIWLVSFMDYDLGYLDLDTRERVGQVTGRGVVVQYDFPQARRVLRKTTHVTGCRHLLSIWSLIGCPHLSCSSRTLRHGDMF